jgi:hypothetical protein
MYDFFVFCLQLAAVTAYLVMVIAFTFGMLHATFKSKPEGFGGLDKNVLDAIKALERKVDAAITPND